MAFKYNRKLNADDTYFFVCNITPYFLIKQMIQAKDEDVCSLLSSCCDPIFNKI